MTLNNQNNHDSHPFMVDVIKYQRKNGTTRTEALKAIAQSKPDLHENYLKSHGCHISKKDQILKNMRDSKTGFMAAVKAYQEVFECSRTEALKTVAARNPKLHEAYLDKAYA